MKFARHLEPISPEDIRRARERVSIKPPTLAETMEYECRTRFKTI